MTRTAQLAEEAVAAYLESTIPPRCMVHRSHRPPVLVIEWHHIWPMHMSGPDVESNTVPICPTGHRNVHRALRALVKGEPMFGTPTERALAKQGYDSWVAVGRPVSPRADGPADSRSTVWRQAHDERELYKSVGLAPPEAAS